MLLPPRPNTAVHLISSRSQPLLEQWFGHLRLGLHAEDGLYSRHAHADVRCSEQPTSHLFRP
jgi:trehalose-6-phosphatase